MAKEQCQELLGGVQVTAGQGEILRQHKRGTQRERVLRKDINGCTWEKEGDTAVRCFIGTGSYVYYKAYGFMGGRYGNQWSLSERN